MIYKTKYIKSIKEKNKIKKKKDKDKRKTVKLPDTL